MTGYEHLCNTIIVRAAQDYRAVVKRLKKNPEDPVLLMELRKLEQFFCSDWFQMLSDADGEQILKQLQREGE